ncbi:MAG: glycosyltransferase family 4 protein [Candidatus Zixiibacteriota bacterium]
MESKLRILAVNWQDPKNPFAGGAEVHLWENLKRFAADGHKVTLVCSQFDGASEQDSYDGVRVIRKGGRFYFNFVAPGLIRKELSRNTYDVIVEDINKIPFYTPIYTDLPILAVIPHLFATTVFREINFVLGTYIYLAEQPIRYFFRKYPYCVISESTKNDLVKRGMPADNITVVECGIDHSFYCLDAAVQKYSKPTALYLGRIKKYKGVQHILTAWPRVLADVPNAKLQIVGDGDYLPALKKVASDLKVADSVEFPGFVSGESKIERMRSAHCVIYPSLKEGWGLTNIEANACGTLAIAADSPGLRDSVSDGVSGALFPYGNKQKLVAAVLKVFKDSDYRERLQRGAVEWASGYDWDTSAGRMLSLLQSVIRKGRPK